MIMCGMIGLFYLVSINQLIMPQKLRNQSLMFLTFGVLCLALRFEIIDSVVHETAKPKVDGQKD